MLPRTEIIVSGNFNPTLGTMGQFFLARSGDASRSAAGRAHEKALTPRAILIRTRSRGFRPSRSLEVSVCCQSLRP